MGTGATTACSCALSQKPGGMVREGVGHTDGGPGVPGKRREGAKLEGFGRSDDDD